MNNINNVFDCQVNYGKSAFGPNCDLDTYMTYAPKEITKVLLIPTLTHITTYDDGITETSCVWSRKDNSTIYSTELFEENHNIVNILNPTNPYRKMNIFTLKKVHALNNTTSLNKKFYFAPKIHPILDNIHALEDMLDNDVVKALKINGLASACGPKDIPKWLINISKTYDLPLFVHTDFNNVTSNFNFLSYLMNINNPHDWYEFALQNNIKIILAHGARGDLTTLRKINKTNNIFVGLGPDLMLNAEKDRLLLKEKDYLSEVLLNCSSKKLLFCTDYRWNVENRLNWDGPDLDWESINRLETIANNIGLKKEDIQNILYNNACDFFKC